MMRTAEFDADVKNGMIEIPVEYRQLFRDTVRVKLSLAQLETQPAMTILDQWLASPLRVRDFQPLNREQVYER